METRTFTNITGKYMLVGDCNTVIVAGSFKECQKKFEKFDLRNSSFSCISFVEPGQTITEYIADVTK
jgi:hypothetical protein